MLKSAGNNSFSDLVSVYLKVNLEFLKYWRHTASFKFGFSEVQDFGNFELHPSFYGISMSQSTIFQSCWDIFLVLSKTLYPLLSTGSTHEDRKLSRHD